MHHDTHGHDSGAEAAGAASWLVAMVLFIVLAVAVIVVRHGGSRREQDLRLRLLRLYFILVLSAARLLKPVAIE